MSPSPDWPLQVSAARAVAKGADGQVIALGGDIGDKGTQVLLTLLLVVQTLIIGIRG